MSGTAVNNKFDNDSFKDVAKTILERIVSDPNSQEYVFPSCLSPKNRAYVHRLAYSIYKGRLLTRSTGQGANRQLHVRRRLEDSVSNPMNSEYFDIIVTPATMQHMQIILTRLPLSSKERAECSTALDKFVAAEMPGDFTRSASGQLSSGLAQIPPNLPSQMPFERQQGMQLLIHCCRQEILDSIGKNQVVIITGEPGCGKTTQVTQMILDECIQKQMQCRIVCTQPRRVAAVSVAARVAAERGEKIGSSVGYQIRLESRVSPKTLLTFCTTGVFLRTIMSGGDAVGHTVTHIFVDEVHERDKYCDFLLIAVKEMITRFPKLRVILMSATIQAEHFSDYFNKCPVIAVPGKNHEVTEYYLEDILEKTTHLSQLRSANSMNSQMLTMLYGLDSAPFSEQPAPAIQQPVLTEDSREMDDLLKKAFTNPADENSLKSLIEFIVDQRVDANYRHSETGITTLMIVAQRGKLDIVENLVRDQGADCSLAANYGWTALDMAQHFGQVAVGKFLSSWSHADHSSKNAESLTENFLVSEYERHFAGYNQTHPKSVDHRLVHTVIKSVHRSAAYDGSILVFVPGYEDITCLRQMLLDDADLMRATPRIQLFTLHSQMQSAEQIRVFRRPPPNTRKVILSTNIAESGITVDDIVFVIDTGLAKEKSFDATVGAHALELRWISRASANQRKGRAGRCRSGVCYRLYSRRKFALLLEHDTPEILRTPLHELCLQAKLLAPKQDGNIVSFLSRAPDPVPAQQSAAAVNLLKQIEALDCFEELTEFGHHMVDLAIPPQLAKMVLYALVLKCLDPVLTIACILAYKDPFILPAGLEQKQAQNQCRRQFEDGVFSDHMAQLRAFQAWQDAKVDGLEFAFCSKNFLSPSTMDMVVGMRSQLLGQLRASNFVRARGTSDIRELNTNSDNWAVVKAALAAGLYPNVAFVDKHKRKVKTSYHPHCRFHVGSVFKSNASIIEAIPTPFLIFDEISKSSGITQLRGCTAITPVTLLLVCGPARLADLGAELPDVAGSDIEGEELSNPTEISGSDAAAPPFEQRFRINDFLKFNIQSQSASLVRQMRAKFQAMVLRRIRAPGKQLTNGDDALLQKVVQILSAEEQLLGIPPPPGIGRRPRPIANEAVLSPGIDDDLVDDSSHILSADQSKPEVKSLSSAAPNVSGATPFDFNNSKPLKPVTRVYSPPRAGASRNTFVFLVSNMRTLTDFHEARRLEAWNAGGPEQASRFAKILGQSGTIYVLFFVEAAGGFNGYARLMAPIPGSCSFRLQWILTSLLPNQFISSRLQSSQLLSMQTAKTSSGNNDSYELSTPVGHSLLRLWSQQNSSSSSSNANNANTTFSNLDTVELLRLVTQQSGAITK